MGSLNIDWDGVGLGARSDTELARELGCSIGTVQRKRAQRGIPPFIRTVGAQAQIEEAVEAETEKARREEACLGGLLLTVEEVAERTRLSTKYVYQLIREGQLPVRRFGRVIRVYWTDLLEAFPATTAPEEQS
jgi:excisionase family DNA binding protein